MRSARHCGLDVCTAAAAAPARRRLDDRDRAAESGGGTFEGRAALDDIARLQLLDLVEKSGP